MSASDPGLVCPRCGAPSTAPAGDPGAVAACPSCGESLCVIGDPSGTAGGPALPGPGTAGALFGRFRLVAHLGAGGMGVVWKAWDPELRRNVALKLMHPAVADSGEAVARFLREARLAARLRHPGIVPVHDVGEVGGCLYQAAEYVEGRTLEAWFAESRPARLAGLPGAWARLRAEVEALAAIAEAVAYAHRAGIVHRDLKPANVILDAAGRPHVVDFGLAKTVPRSGEAPREVGPSLVTETGALLGTPAYMSPEQATGEVARIGPATDVWALGAMLFELLAGRGPFVGAQVMEILRATIEEDARLPPAAAAAPRELQAICLKALEKEIPRRFSDAGEMAEELRRWLRDEPVRTAAASRGRRAVRWATRRARPLAFAVLALVLGIGALAGGAVHQARRRAAAIEARELVAGQVHALEDSVLSAEAGPEARRLLARQAEGMLALIVAELPESGAGYAWRGKVRMLLGDAAGAREDFDRACALSPEDPTGWCLRGVERIGRFQASRGLPVAMSGNVGVEFLPLAEPTPDEAAWWKSGLADLGEMERRLRGSSGVLGETDARFGRAVALFYTGGDDAYRCALEALADAPGAATARLRGLAQYHLRQFDAALRELDEAVVAWPADPESRLYRGLVHEAVGLDQEARDRDPREPLQRGLADLREAVRLDPDLPFHHTAVGIGCCLLAMAEKVRGGDPAVRFAEAIQACDRSLALVRPQTNALYVRGTALYGLGSAEAERGRDGRERLRQAIADFDEVLRAQPGHSAARNQRALAWLELGEDDQRAGHDPRESLRRALADLDEAARANSQSLNTHSNRGTVLLTLAEAADQRGEDPDPGLREALAEFDEVIRLRPQSHHGHQCRGNVHQVRGTLRERRGIDPVPDLESAIADYGRALARFPDLVVALDNRGICRTRLGHAVAGSGRDPTGLYHAAAEDFRAVLRLRPEKTAVHVNLGNALRSLGEAEFARGHVPTESYRAAIREYDHALAAAPDDLVAWNGRGIAYALLAQAETARGEDPRANLRQAIADQDDALRRRSNYFEALADRGGVRVLLGQAESARGEDPRGSFRAAAEDLSAAARARPADSSVRSRLGTALFRLGQADAARGADPRETLGRAIGALDDALRLAPGSTQGLNSRGLTWGAIGQAELQRGIDPEESFERAEADFRAAVARHDPVARGNLALLHGGMARFHEALLGMEEAALAAPAYAAAFRAEAERIRATAAREPERWRQEVNFANAALGKDGAVAELHFERGLAGWKKLSACLPPDQRAAYPSEAGERAVLAHAHVRLAELLAQRSAGGGGEEQRRGLRDRALDLLAEAVRLGFDGCAEARQSPALAPLRDDPRFEAALGGGK